MSPAEKVVRGANKFYEKLKDDEHGRYRSWEHCYNAFFCARVENADVDAMSLHLAFYLASWGMYRGSSFLLQQDYRIHLPVVKYILQPKFNVLQGADCKRIAEDSSYALIDELNGFISNYYQPIHDRMSKTKGRNNISDTLITKILMGTLGCVPAYDRYFIAGIKKTAVAGGRYNYNSIKELANFYNDNAELFEKARCNMKVYGRQYPQMKVLDMGFWQLGMDS